MTEPLSVLPALALSTIRRLSAVLSLSMAFSKHLGKAPAGTEGRWGRGQMEVLHLLPSDHDRPRRHRLSDEHRAHAPSGASSSREPSLGGLSSQHWQQQVKVRDGHGEGAQCLSALSKQHTGGTWSSPWLGQGGMHGACGSSIGSACDSSE